MKNKLLSFLNPPSSFGALQGYFVKWEISIRTLVVLFGSPSFSLSSFLKRHFGWGFL